VAGEQEEVAILHSQEQEEGYDHEPEIVASSTDTLPEDLTELGHSDISPLLTSLNQNQHFLSNTPPFVS
jgi:hypothetical protein